jgi:hypothetical protein
MTTKPKNMPYLPPEYMPADVIAVQALAAGNATPEQQQRALKWVIEVGAGTYDMSFRPGGQEGERDTAFAEGRRFVGLQLVKLTRLNVAKLKEKSHVVS